MRVPQVGEEFGRYHLDRVLGQGGMGIVYAATDPRLNRTVALKVITGVLADSPEFRARFQAEAESLARLDSPHVIGIYDHDEIDGTPFIVTQYIDGTDLWNHLNDGGPMPAKQALTLCAQLARGLADAHRVGVIHRDVKPGNVLLRHAGTPDAHAYLCDFGIARSDGIDGAAPTATGTVAGTWSYLSPERTNGEPASPASDIYALGCLLWTCLTGTEPFRGTDVQIAVAHQQAPIPSLPGDSGFIADLNRILSTSMAKDPAERYADATTFRGELERLAAVAPDDTVERDAGPTTVIRPATPAAADGLPGLPPPPPAQPAQPAQPAEPSTGASPRRRSKLPLVGAVAGLVVVALLIGLTVWLLRDDGGQGGGDQAADPGVSGDLTGDDFGDVLVHQSRFGAISPLGLFTVPSTGLQFGSPQRASAEIGNPMLGDVDGDGRTDVAWIKEDDDRMAVTVVPGDGQKWTTELTLDPVFDIKDYNAGIGDLDDDGKDDLILFGDATDELDGLHVALATGDDFAQPTQWYSSDLTESQVRVGDFDGDDKDEVVYFGVHRDEAKDVSIDYMRLLRPQDGTLVKVAEKRLPGAAVDPGLAPWRVGDVDGDGDVELVVSNVTRRVIFVYGVEGDAFVDRVRWAETSRSREDSRYQFENSTWASAGLSDVDGDGDDDLVELHTSGSESDTELILRVQLSDGERFGDPQDWGRITCGSECTDSFDIVE